MGNGNPGIQAIRYPNLRRTAVKITLTFAALVVLVDLIYKVTQNISYADRSKCLVYRYLPELVFLFFEYFVELTILILLGIFVAVLIEKHFTKVKRFIPANPATAFIFASLLPVCACAVIPIIKIMQGKVKYRTLVTFLVAAPLLNPYILVLSISVLGITYGTLRIVSSFILAVSAGYALGFFFERLPLTEATRGICSRDTCRTIRHDVYQRTFYIFKSLLPYLIAGGLMAVGLDYFSSKSMGIVTKIGNNLLGNLLVIIIGTPFYFCNGSDVLLLRPLLCSGVSLGTGIAFSLTATSICITSIMMLIKFAGIRITLFLVCHIMVMTLFLSQLIRLVI
ncbi:MAG: permease [Desulfobacterales bacterium]|jgi:uncharacterized membrane protein YraQ (UPF0718 family)